jgi:hypothetical protein
MRNRGSSPARRPSILVAATAALLLLASAPAGAAEDPAGDLLDTVQQAVNDVVAPGGAGAPAPAGTNPALSPVQDDDPDKEMADPVSPDHGSADNATVEIAQNDVAAIGQTKSTVGDDDSASADASALALGGNEIVGAHAKGNQSSSAGDPLEPVCEQTDGALCVELVKAEAESSDTGGAQSGHSASEVAGACVGGSDPTATECAGPVSAGVLTSESDIERGKDGHTRASSSSAVADVCLVQDPVAGSCAVGAEALSSSGESSSNGNTASKEATFLGLEIAGTPIALIEDPTAIEVAPDCPDGMQVACVFLLQGETYLGSAGHAITTLDANVLNGTVLATLSHSESLVHKFPADVPPGGPQPPAGDGAPDAGNDGSGPAGGQAADGGVLPNTGGVLGGLLSLALFGLALGSFLVAWSRRVALSGAAPAGAALADGTA